MSEGSTGAVRTVVAADGARADVSDDRAPLIHRDVVSYARRDGRYSSRNAAAGGPRLAHYFVTPPRAQRVTSIDAGWRFDPVAAFGRCAPLVVEIGSGTGDAVLAHAAAYPGWDHLAVEVYRPGVARTVVQAHARAVTNLRVLEGDGRQLVARNLPDASVRELHVWFPDPWPKARHHKRRLVDAGFLADAARVLERGGMLRVATDWHDYAERIGRVADEARALFECSEPAAVPGSAHRDRRRGDDAARYGHASRYDVRPVTRFESKAAALGRGIADFALCRR